VRAEAIAHHGWGFDQQCWCNWQVALAEQGIILQTADQGYFGPRLTPRFQTEAPKLLLAHSFGLHQIPMETLASAQGLIILAGFLTFHPSQEPQHSRSVAALTALQQQFEQQPQVTLAAFRQQCFRPQADPFNLPTQLNRAVLARDLAALHTHQLDLAMVRQIPQILWMQGHLDRIVPLAVGQALAQALPQATQRELPRSGHGFPFSETNLCIEHVLAWLSPWCP
jgi:pimeloyl-[acyl-carrier protein] methyl ester esterase